MGPMARSKHSPKYLAYLKSPKWFAFRARYLSKHDGKCGACHRVVASFDIHHKTYERLGREELGDVIALCRECHDSVHQLRKRLGSAFPVRAATSIVVNRGKPKAFRSRLPLELKTQLRDAARLRLTIPLGH